MTLDERKRIRPRADVLIQTVGDEAVLLNLLTEQYIGLNPVATRIWAVLSSSDSIASALETLIREYEVEAGILRQDLQSFVDELVAHKLVDIFEPPSGARHEKTSSF